MSDLSCLLAILNQEFGRPDGDPGPNLTEAQVRRVSALADRLGLFRAWWKAIQAQSELPEPILADMAARAAELSRAVLAATLECSRALDAFRARGIPVVVLKGLGLAQLAYGDPLARQLADLDLLVSEEDLVASRAVLEAAGYEAFAPLGRGHVPLARIDMRGQRILLDAGHEIVFMSAAATMPIELHWRLTPRFFRVKASVPGLVARRREVPTLDGVTVPALSAEDTVIALAVEIARDGWADLEHLLAFSGLVTATNLDWALIRNRADTWGCRSLLEIARLVASAVVASQPIFPTDTRVRRLAQSVAAPWLAGQLVADREQRLGTRDLRARDSLADAALMLLDYSFRPTLAEYMSLGPRCPWPILGLARASHLAARNLG